MKKLAILAVGVLALSVVVWAHPHVQKSVTAKLQDGTELKLNFYTSPANMDHVTNAEPGVFKGGARLSISTDIESGDTKIPAGNYTVGAVKDENGGWTMALYPGQLGRGDSPDMSKLIKLPSSLSKDQGSSDHTSFDLAPGSGDQAGHLTVIWHFGSLHLAGALN